MNLPRSSTVRIASLATLGVLGAATLVTPTPTALALEAPVPGARSAGDSLFPNVGNSGYDVSHYDLDLTYTNAGPIEATAAIDATTTGAPLSEFSLDFKGLTVSSVTVNGQSATWSRVADADATNFKLVVTPATPVSGTFTTVVTYAGQPRAYTDPDGSSEGWNLTNDGVIALNEPIGTMTYFPNNNTPRDKATFDISVTAPAGLVVVSNGELAAAPANGAAGTWQWVQKRQQAPYLSMLAIGNFKRGNGTVSVGDGVSVPEWSFWDPNSVAPSGARTQIGRIIRAMADYGAYPGGSTGVVVDEVPEDINYALETQDRSFFPTSVDRTTLVHELAHQWFGNAVSPADWSDVWLNEGPATWFEHAINHDLYGGPNPYTALRIEWKEAPSSEWQTPVTNFNDPAKLFGWQVYQRGAITLEALRVKVGDAMFDRILRTWIRTYEGRSATTAQFIALAERVSERQLDVFFKTWLDTRSRPAFPNVLTASPVPQILGRARVGDKLRVKLGTWDSRAKVKVRWLRDGKAITGATNRSYLLKRADAGHRIKVVTTGQRTGFPAVKRTSKPVQVRR